MGKGQKTFWLEEDALNKMKNFASDASEVETGGLLLGYVGRNGEPVVAGIVGPGPKAIHRSHSFVPDYDYHRKMALRVFKETEGMTTYLGDWHTHPNGIPCMSMKDRRALYRIGIATQPMGVEPFMFILGGNSSMWCYAAFQRDGQSCGFIRSRWLSPKGIEMRVKVVGRNAQ